MKTILLLVHDDQGQEARLQAALDVTRAVNGHLTCLDVIAPPLALAYDDCSGVAMAMLIEDERKRESANRAALEARLSREDVAWSWHEGTPGPDTIDEASGLADLIVLSSRLDAPAPAELRRLASHVAEDARRPVLAVPADARGIDVTAPVLVAWNGSRGAEDALCDAVPLMTFSSDVVLFDLDAPGGAFAAAGAAEYLSRQGIHARIEAAARRAGDLVYAEILEKAALVGAAYVVMGAYGHSSAVEAVFGGVTRSMLAHSGLPLFLSR